MSRSNSIEKFLDVVAYLRQSIHTDFAMPQLHVFLHVCEHEGVTMASISEALKMPQGSLSRNIKQLSKYFNEKKEADGYDLVRLEPDMEDRRKLAVWLTKHGQEVKAKLEALLA